nr:uncharacterized protein LOC113803236 isoform X2 [Penaeus vannamei]
MACGEVIGELRMLGETEGVVVDTAAIDATLTAIESTEQTLQESVELLSSAADASSSVLVTQESSTFIANMEVQFQSFVDAVGTVTDESSVIEDPILLEQATLFSSSLIKLSLMSTTISQEILQDLKSSSEILFTSDLVENPRFVPDLKAAAYFVLDSDISLSQVIGGFAVGSTLQKSQTQGKLFVSKGAQTILEEFSVAMTGIKEAGGTTDPDPENASVLQMKKIIQDSMNILGEWTSGNIEEYQLEMCRGFLRELPSLTASLEDFAPLPELEDLSVEMEAATQSITTTIERINSEEIEDQEDADTDGVFMYCGQLESFTGGIVDIDENGNEVELQEVDAMLTFLQDVSADPLSIDMASVQGTVQPFMNVMQGVEAGTSVKNYKKVTQLLGDITESLASTRQSTIFTRAGEAGLAVMGGIPYGGIGEESNALTAVLEVQELSMMVSSMTTSTFSLSRGLVRELSAAAPKLQMAIGTYNGNIASLSILEENLAVFSRSTNNYAFYTTQEYVSTRTFQILEESASIIAAATTALRTLTMSMGSVVTYESNEQISMAFEMLSPFAADLSTLPLDLKTQLEEIDFSSVTLPESEDTGIEKLLEVYTIMNGLNEAISSSTLNTQYLESLAKTTPANDAMTSIINSLTSFMTIPSEDGDDSGNDGDSEGGDSENDGDSEGGDSENDGDSEGGDGSDADGDGSEGDGSGGDVEVDVNAIIADVKAASGNLFANGLVMPEGDVETLIAASETLSTISPTMGAELADIPSLISELSATSTQVSQSVRGYGTAIQNKLMYSSIEDIATVSTLIKSAVSVGVPAGAQDLVDSMVTLFKTFVMGSAFISQEDVVSVKSLAYQFSVMADGNAGVDVTELMELIDQTETVLLATQGFLSSQQLFFNSMMEEEFDMEVNKAKSEQNSAYQQYYFLSAMDSLLTSLTGNLTGLIDAGGSGEEMNKSSLTSIRAALTTASADMGSMDMNLVSGIGMSLIGIQEAQTSGLSVDVTEVENLRSFVESVQVTFNDESSMMEGYGRTITDVFAAQNALNTLDAFESETKIWFGEGDGADSSGGDSGDGADSSGGDSGDGADSSGGDSGDGADSSGGDSGDGADSSGGDSGDGADSSGGDSGDGADSSGGDSGDGADSSGGDSGDGADSSGGEDGDEGEEDSLQSLVTEVSDILMSWTFDSSAVEGSSVVTFERALKQLTSMFDVASEGDIPELQIWKYSIEESSLSELISSVYLGTAQERAGIEEVAYRFNSIHTVLGDLLEILGGGDSSEGEEGGEGNEGDGSEGGSDGGDGSEGGSDGGDGSEGSDGEGNSGKLTKKDKKAKEMNANRIYQITTEITSILNGLESPKDIRQDQIKKMKKFNKELKSLLKVEGANLGDDDGAELKALVQQQMDGYGEALELMTTYSEEVSSKVQIMKEISFFQEIVNFLQYSLNLFDSADGSSSGADEGESGSDTGGGSDGGDTGDESGGSDTGGGDTGDESGGSDTGGGDTGGDESSGGDTGDESGGSDTGGGDTGGDESSGDDTGDGDGGEDCSIEDGVLCASEQLLEALKLAEAGGSDSEDDAAGDSDSEDGAAGGSDSEDGAAGGSDSEDDAAGGSDSGGDAAEGDSSDNGASGMDSSTTFRYQNVREKMHGFSKAMRHFSKEESGSLASAKTLIEEAKVIAEKFVTDLTTESSSMTSFTDVSAHYTAPEVTVTTS